MASLVPTPRRLFGILAAAAGLLGPASVRSLGEPATADALSVYTGKIRPLLAERCFSCHGSLTQEAGLRLDTVSLMAEGGDSGAAIVKGDPATSLLLERVADADADARMPPAGEGEPLTTEQLAMLRDWVAAGAPAPADEKPEADPRSHWAFQPRTRPEIPKVSNAAWVRTPVDAFLAAAHDKAGLVPQPEANRNLLVRRLYLDLIGLPPAPEELASIAADRSPDWYEKVVDRLLADPRHGERWARHWMDVWRYSDWWGLGEEIRNSQRHMWHWRDWIVESLNADVPYDEMVRQMLAADELYPNDLDKLRATGYLARNWYVFNRTPWLDETVEHVGKGLLGLTLNCSKCHAHKYDPIVQKDYYRMRAFFEPYHVRMDLVPGEADLQKDGIPRVFDRNVDAPTYLFVRGDDQKPDTSQAIEPGIPDVLSFGDLDIVPVELPKEAFEPQRRPWVIESHLTLADRNVTTAAAALAKATEAVAAPPAKDATAAARDTVREAFRKAEDALRLARAERVSIVATAAAMRAATAAETAPDDAGRRQHASTTARAAVVAERALTAERERVKLAAAERTLAAATDAKREGAAKNVATAREAVAKAEAAAAEPGEAFTPLRGARWSPTRFAESRTDDKEIPFPRTSTGRRTALARWLTDPRNPLVARVAANHIWMRHMGRPLVPTVFDFGRKGNVPTHPELLDWLASELVDGPAGGSGWSMRHLHRLIVTSASYRMGSSIARATANLKADPDNRLLWRREPIRLEAQVIRDCILAHAGTLDPRIGGPSVPPSAQATSARRSLYFFHSDIERNLFLTTFDDAEVKECYARDQSIVPQQALALANSGLVHDAVEKIASRIQAGLASELRGAPPGDEAFVVRAFVLLLEREPTAAERQVCAKAMAAWRGLATTEGRRNGDVAPAHLVWALVNHNDFVTLR